MVRSSLFYETIGCFAALLSACAWSFSSILFRRVGDESSPIGMNVGKCIVGIIVLGVLLLLIGIKPVSTRDFLFLGISGLLGIAFGDTLFFKALIYLGPKLTLLLETLGPAVTVILAVIVLHEKPSFLSWIGILLTLAGINLVLWKDYARMTKEIKKNRSLGILYALLSVLCIALGIILAKIGIASTSALQATFIRFLWAGIGLTLLGLTSHQLKNWLMPFKDSRLLKLTLFAIFIAIFGGFWLFLVSLKYIDASIATILNSTAPLFILPMTAVILKEKISLQEIFGATIAVSGVVLIFIK